MTRSKTILVPTDFSNAARNATDYAIQLAKEMKYELILLHIYDTPILETPGIAGVLAIDLNELELGVQKRLAEEALVLKTKSGIEVKYESINGFIEEEILDAEKRHEPVMIVMGMKSAGTLSEMVIGSIATDLLLKVHTPLLIVPEKATFRGIGRIAFGNDPKIQTDIEINESVKLMMQHFYATVYILTVVKDYEASRIDRKSIEDKMEKHFENRFHSYHFLENEDVIEAINDFIDLKDIDVVVMMPYRHTFFERLLHKPHTKRLAFHTHIPLLSLANVPHA